MNNKASPRIAQDFIVSNHPISLVRIAHSKLNKFLQDPKSNLIRFFFLNKSSRQIREEGRISLYRYLMTIILHTNFSTMICGNRDDQGMVIPYSIEYLARKAGITLQTAKKWNSKLARIGYLKVTHKIVWDKNRCKFSSKPSIKRLTDIFFHDLGIKENVLRRTIEIAKDVARKIVTKARSINSYVIDEITHIRKKTNPEVKHTTEKIPRIVFDLFKKSLFNS